MSSLYNKGFYDSQSRESYKSAKIVLEILMRRLNNHNFGSIIDFGCGVGSWLAASKELGFDTILGVDGDYVPRDMLMIDNHEFQSFDLSKPKLFNLSGDRYDLALSLEVVEHIIESDASDFIKLLTSKSDMVLFSAAIPYQGGHGHVNENWVEYWADKFSEEGFLPIDIVRPEIWNNENVCWWYRQNIILFVNKNKISHLPPNMILNTPLSIVHPEQYLLAVHREKTNRYYSLNQDIKYYQSIPSKKSKSISTQAYGREYSYSERDKITKFEELIGSDEINKNAVFHDAISNIKVNKCKVNFSNQKSVPDFLCVGAQKSGTTWLYENLKQQTEVWLPPLKEINFFNRLVFSEGSAYSGRWARQSAISRLHNATKNTLIDDNWLNFLFHFCKKDVDLEWYSNIYEKAPSKKISGDITPEYAMLPEEIIRNIKMLNPRIKIVFILREPRDRILSQVRMIMDNTSSYLDFEAIRKLATLESVLERSEYKKHISKWLKVFERDQVFIANYESISVDPKLFILKISEFLGFKPDFDSPYLENKIFKSKIDLNMKVDELLPKHLDGHFREVWEGINFDV